MIVFELFWLWFFAVGPVIKIRPSGSNILCLAFGRWALGPSWMHFAGGPQDIIIGDGGVGLCQFEVYPGLVQQGLCVDAVGGIDEVVTVLGFGDAFVLFCLGNGHL